MSNVRKKLALLDTDFLSKTHLTTKDSTHRLVDLVLALPDYTFFCHQKTVDELAIHGIGGAPQWLHDKIAAGVIKCYTDQDILQTLGSIYGPGKYSYFLSFLKDSCEAYEAGYFANHFAPLLALDHTVDEAVFLQTLDQCEKAIGPHQSLGEKKSLLLLLTLQLLQPGNVYVFCSDDGGARRGVVSIGGVRCISVISLFHQLRELGTTKAEADPYFTAYEAFCASHNQRIFKVRERTSAQRFLKVPCRQVFDEIYDGKFECLLNGDLMYIN